MNFKLVILVPFLILLFFNGIWAMRNPYEILGVAKHASLGDIRKAYKQLAKEW
jgi:preprotein translocase subunit Sec63